MEMTDNDVIYVYDALKSYFIGHGHRGDTNGLLQRLNRAVLNGWVKDSDFISPAGEHSSYFVVIRKPLDRLTEEERERLVPQHNIQLS